MHRLLRIHVSRVAREVSGAAERSRVLVDGIDVGIEEGLAADPLREAAVRVEVKGQEPKGNVVEAQRTCHCCRISCSVEHAFLAEDLFRVGQPRRPTVSNATGTESGQRLRVAERYSRRVTDRGAYLA